MTKAYFKYEIVGFSYLVENRPFLTRELMTM